MKIAEIAPPYLPVPPASYGGIEVIVAALADGLAERGHDVTLFASGGSSTRGQLVSPLTDAPGPENLGEGAYGLGHSAAAHRRAGEFDVVHDHTLEGPALAATTATRRWSTPCMAPGLRPCGTTTDSCTKHCTWLPSAKASGAIIRISTTREQCRTASTSTPIPTERRRKTSWSMWVGPPPTRVPEM